MDEHDHEHDPMEQDDEGIVDKIKDAIGWE